MPLCPNRPPSRPIRRRWLILPVRTAFWMQAVRCLKPAGELGVPKCGNEEMHVGLPFPMTTNRRPIGDTRDAGFETQTICV